MQNLQSYSYIDENESKGECYPILDADEGIDIQSYPQQLWFFVNTTHLDASVESELIEALEEKNGAIFVAKRVVDGWSEYYLYAQYAKGFKNVVSSFLQSKVNFELGVNVDKKWTLYFQELLPDIFNYHIMVAKDTIDALLKEGDTLDSVREVEHYMQFLTKTQLERVKSVLEVNGFSTKEIKQESKQEYSYILISTKIHSMQLQEVSEIISDILERVLVEHGEYIGFSTVMADA